MGNVCKSLGLCGCIIPTNIDDDEEFYSELDKKKPIEKRLKKPANCSFKLLPDTSLIGVSRFQSDTSIQGEEFIYMEDLHTSILFNDSTFTWSSDVESLDLQSFDSGFNSSLSLSISSSFECGSIPSAATECLRLEIADYSIRFDSVLAQYLDKSRSENDFGLFSGVETLFNLPVILKNAFFSWSKSSLRRLGYSVLSHFLKFNRIKSGFLENSKKMILVDNRSSIISSCINSKPAQLSLFRNFISFANQSDLISRFYSQYCLNF